MLRIGLFGKARVVTKGERAGEPSLVVPRSALTDVAGKQVVFVHGSGEQFRRRADSAPTFIPSEEFELHEVTSGEGAAGKVRILSGLREGEEVVFSGAFTIKSVLLRGTLADQE
jgi:cobalt-zinc-cadmium efflux system membrane fusion protein